MASPLPTVPEEVTVAWLASVLNLPVKSAEFTQQVLVATTSKLFTTLTYSDEDESASSADRPHKVVVKGGFNPPLQAPLMQLLAGMYRAEAEFYSVLAPLMPALKTPKSWWVGTEDQQAIIIMDDLAASGHSFGDAAHAWPPARVRQAVEQLAGLHAATWNQTSSKPVEGSSSVVQFPPSSHYETILLGLSQLWEQLILAADRPQAPEDMRSQERVVAALHKHFATRNPRFMCLVHGDPHVGNTYLEPTTDADADAEALGGWKGRYLDWQTYHYGTCFHDIAYFIGGALSVEDRRAHEMDILDHYLATLAKLGGPTLSREDPEVMVEYRKSCMAGWGWLLTPFHTQSVERVFAMVPRFVAQMQDHKTLELVASRILPANAPDLKRPGSSGNPGQTHDSAGDPVYSGIQEPAVIEEGEYEMMLASLEDFESENIKVRDAMKNFKFPEE